MGQTSGVSNTVSISSLQGCARVLLKFLNVLDLPSAAQWGQTYPQGVDESGLDFMDRTAEQKPAKMLGRSALSFVFPDLEARLLSEVAAHACSARASEEEFASFVQGFGATLAPSEGNDEDLVWTTDVQASIAARHEARKVEAAERLERAASAEAFADELRASLAPLPSSTVQVEEVEED